MKKGYLLALSVLLLSCSNKNNDSLENDFSSVNENITYEYKLNYRILQIIDKNERGINALVLANIGLNNNPNSEISNSIGTTFISNDFLDINSFQVCNEYVIKIEKDVAGITINDTFPYQFPSLIDSTTSGINISLESEKIVEQIDGKQLIQFASVVNRMEINSVFLEYYDNNILINDAIELFATKHNLDSNNYYFTDSYTSWINDDYPLIDDEKILTEPITIYYMPVN